LHTTNIYPTPPELARLGGVTELIDAFPNSVIGYSDHTTTNHACFGAVALGACFLERHFTDNMDRIGPDIENSMDSKSAKELIEGSKIIFKARGGSKGLIDEEKTVSGFAFASVVSIKDIKRGDILSYENIWVKRPGGGYYTTNDFEKILGKKALRNIKKDVQISKEDIE
jgi:N-acetylneuraminate synthase